ncbi:MFS transporter, DHA1 family, bicyclomycin/chloramphenicol resistance protein [Roseivivax halotolerans]|uniref:Bcr/CflA family efflux transporter n=1 Tax=Roseivivax halotolerans TaxID=93684 RepID=A0A1I5YMV4_9RHOB|nr:multidrug effflux MFS transporter [Roseivivax halotolerans]SFQ45450.1 MFS transporter, DHA1 family, bicyclomycin/chloramphenicol resistance protein [Roseivivax halotolerans]
MTHPVASPAPSQAPHDREPTSAAERIPYWEFVGMIAFLMALNAAAIDVYIPGLSEIGAALGVADDNTRQLVIGAYVIGFGGAQVIYGPLSDRFGRRPVLFFGLGLYCAAAIAAVFAPTFGTLLALRLLQGIGAASTRVVALSVVRDRFKGEAMASVMSLVMMVFMVMPVLAPNIGSAVLLFGDWRVLAAVMFLFGAAAFFWTWFRLPETLREEDRRELSGARVWEAFRIIFTNRRAFGYTLATGAFFGVLFSFIAQAEQIYVEVFGIGAEFTLYFALVACFMAASSFANSRLVRIFGTRRLSHSALTGFAILGAIHFALAASMGGATPFWLFLVLLIPQFCFFGFIPANFNSLAMEELGHVAGTASAVLGTVQTLGGGIIGSALGLLYNGTILPMFGGFAILGVISLTLAAYAEGWGLYQRRRA